MVSDPEESAQRSRSASSNGPARPYRGRPAVEPDATDVFYARSHTVRVSKRRNWLSKPAAVAVSDFPSSETT